MNKDIKLWQKEIENEIDKLNWEIEPKNLYAPIEYTLALGGKRIRPICLLLANHIFSGDHSKAKCKAEMVGQEERRLRSGRWKLV